MSSRFISRDTDEGKITNPLTLNLYAYCNENPVMNVDPSGHGAFYDRKLNSDAGKNLNSEKQSFNDEVSQQLYLMSQFGPLEVPCEVADYLGMRLLAGMGKVFGNSAAGYLEKPVMNGILNIGAGQKPLEGAYNIDINEAVLNSAVHYGDAENLANVPSGSQCGVIINNPYGYTALNPEVHRVLKTNAILEITGTMSNSYFKRIFNMTSEQLESAGYSLISKDVAASWVTGYTSTGKAIQGTIMEIGLRKN